MAEFHTVEDSPQLAAGSFNPVELSTALVEQSS
jgi:hypothetical protein